MRELLAEFFGTFILIVFGVGVVAQVVLSKHTAGDTLSINIAWGLAVTLGCYVSAGVTGAHLNPAVTLALAVHRKLPWSKVLPYSVAQLAGAFVASVVVFITYHEALNTFDGGIRQVLGAQGTAGIWATYPQPFLSTFPGGFIDQVVGTALLIAGIFGITDSRNSPAPAGLAPVVVGLLVLAIGGSTPAMRSTRRAISVRGCSRSSPGGAAKSSAPATRGGGCRSWRRASAGCWAASPTTCSSAIASRRSDAIVRLGTAG